MNQEQFEIYRHLAGRLIDGQLSPGSHIESEQELARKFSTTRMNAYRAIKQLERRGIVSRSKRAGTRVSAPVNPNLLRQLKCEMTRRICVIHSRNSYEYLHWTGEFRRTLQQALAAEDFTLEDVHLDDVRDRAELKEKLLRLTETGIAAFILSVRGEEDEFLIENSNLFFQYHNKIFVYQSGAMSWMHWPFHTVTVNIFGEGSLAAKYLMEKGIRKIAYCRREISSKNYLDFNRERLLGVEFTMRRLSDGRNKPEEWVGLEQIYRNCMENGSGCGLIVSTDELAARIIDYFAERGAKRPPEMISFDNNSEYDSYRLTTIAPPHVEMAQTLGRLIFDNIDIDSECDFVSYIKIDSKLIINHQE